MKTDYLTKLHDHWQDFYSNKEILEKIVRRFFFSSDTKREIIVSNIVLEDDRYPNCFLDISFDYEEYTDSGGGMGKVALELKPTPFSAGEFLRQVKKYKRICKDRDLILITTQKIWNDVPPAFKNEFNKLHLKKLILN